MEYDMKVLQKSDIRKDIIERRKSLTGADIEEFNSKIARKLFGDDDFKSAESVLVYAGRENSGEVATEEIIQYCFEQGKKVFLPKTNMDDGTITASQINDIKSDTKISSVGIREPINDRPGKIDLVILPGVAYDREGNRIGYGLGCYDRYLKKNKAVKIAIAYDLQLVDYIPEEKHDIKVDKIITERETIVCGDKNA